MAVSCLPCNQGPRGCLRMLLAEGVSVVVVQRENGWYTPSRITGIVGVVIHQWTKKGLADEEDRIHGSGHLAGSSNILLHA